jgi:hypothetical protein
MYLHQHLHGKHHMKAYELTAENMKASSYSLCDSIYPYRINVLILHMAKTMFKNIYNDFLYKYRCEPNLTHKLFP